MQIHRRHTRVELNLYAENNYLISSGYEVMITVRTQQFNLTGDRHGHASVSSTSNSINEAVMEGITIQENQLQNNSINISFIW